MTISGISNPYDPIYFSDISDPALPQLACFTALMHKTRYSEISIEMLLPMPKIRITYLRTKARNLTLWKIYIYIYL